MTDAELGKCGFTGMPCEMKCGIQEVILGTARPCFLGFTIAMFAWRRYLKLYKGNQGDVHTVDEYTLAFKIQKPNPEDIKENIVLGEYGVSAGKVFESWLPA